ncbi:MULTISPECIES: oxidoreductase [unclassified Streptomyces]|uniref:oxidoreductase n=1 Tax=unclassified Streptomyces TaxID=2593676 RepID=UPI000DAB6014|nr:MULTISPECIES: oxidoreductase [unclassified Streptomyces]PZT74584.1 oxidoreductase [Streptomyces sp. AC1-42T]PZT82430.1 oxidoreductase [Streptomyces sp. AC1-42W]
MTELHDEDLPDGLSAAELGMWQSFRNGTTYDLRTRDRVLDDPFAPHEWGPERSVAARMVARLLLSGPAARPGRVTALKLWGVRITGKLDLAGGRVDPYVELTGCRFDEEVAFPECHFTTLRLVGCAVPRLEAARLRTEGDLHLPRCRVERGIRLTDAQIGTDLLVSQIEVGPDRQGRALLGDGLTVAQDLQAEMVDMLGELSLRGAKVGGSLSLRGSRLRAVRGRRALNAPQLSVERTLYMSEAWVSLDTGFQGTTPPYGIATSPTPARGTRSQVFRCRGGVRLDDGRFGDAVDLHKAVFVLDAHEELSLRRTVTPELRFNPERPVHGRVVLNGAKVVTLIDVSTSWPGPGGLAMGGFVYENLVPYGHFPLSRRLEWVAAATPEYVPEPYERLAAVLRNSGEDADAREVLLAKQRRRRETLPPAGKLWGYLQDWTVAYGYRPGRAAVWMAVLWAAGTLAFSRYDPAAIKGDEHPRWNAALYALDLLIPVIDLGQDGYWRMEGGWQWMAAALILLGWILATTVAAGASRLLRRG